VILMVVILLLIVVYTRLVGTERLAG
jgi:hypothetical protein